MNEIDLNIIRAERSAFNRTVDLYLFNQRAGRPSEVARPVEFVDHARGEMATPFLQLHEERAQELIDELWRAGLRPTQGRQSEGVTEAQRVHLDDMRAIAFAKLKVEQPNGQG